MGWDPAVVPDPQDPATYHRSRLDWDELDTGRHAVLLEVYRRLAALRRELPELTDPDLRQVDVEVDEEARTLVMRRGAVSVVVNVGSTPGEVDAVGEHEVLFATPAGATLWSRTASTCLRTPVRWCGARAESASGKTGCGPPLRGIVSPERGDDDQPRIGVGPARRPNPTDTGGATMTARQAMSDVADNLRHLAGYEVCGIEVLRSDDALEFVALATDDPPHPQGVRRRQLAACPRCIPRSTRAPDRPADLHPGRGHDPRGLRADPALRRLPDIAPTDDLTRWHAEDMLVAQVRRRPGQAALPRLLRRAA